MRLTACKRCGAKIWWGETPTGGKMPLDAEPPKFGGNVVVMDPDADTPLVMVLHKGDDDHGQQRWKAHFATCPKAGTHRRR